MKRLAFLLAPLLMAQSPAGPQPTLVPDVSQRDIEIAYSFTGAELLLFGAILYPGEGGRSRRPADIVVVVKGPTESIQVREKQKVAGIWVNAERTRYRSAPSFFAVARNRLPFRRSRSTRSGSACITAKAASAAAASGGDMPTL